jgi:chromate transport protein ChrA
MQELEKPAYKDLLLMFLKLGFTAFGGPATVNHSEKR